MDEERYEQNLENDSDIQNEYVEQSVIRNIDAVTDMEINSTNSNYDPSNMNNGANINFAKPLVRTRKPSFNRYQSFSDMNKNGGFVRMAGIGGIIAVAAFIVLYLMFRQ